MRFVSYILVLVLAFALSGVEALATDCCATGCEEETAQQQPGAPLHDDHRDAPPVSCHACPCAGTVTPVLAEVLAVPVLAPLVRREWWEPAMKPSSPHARGVFQPPRAS